MKLRTELLRVDADAYHRDELCDEPSLSNSIATVLERQSPAHAYARHPRLGGRARRESSKAFDAGTLAHKLLLDEGAEVAIVEADDWRSKAARAERDEARSTGRIPVLAHEYENAKGAADVLRCRFADLGIVLDGESEVTALWVETADDGTPVQCRGMLDHLKAPTIYDLKSSRSAHPDVCRQHAEAYGYASQCAAYVSAIEKIHPGLIGRVDMVLVFFELSDPWAVYPVRLDGMFRQIGERRWRRAVNTWARCMREGAWPGYATGIERLEPPRWALADDVEKQLVTEGEPTGFPAGLEMP